MALENLDIRISADTADFLAGAEGVEASLGDVSSEALQTAAAMQVLQGRTDEAGDELLNLTPRAATASAGLQGVGISATGTSTAFGGLALVTVASLVPALITLSSVLFPLVGALGGFVAIAGAIGGIGIAGAIGAMATETERLKEQFESLRATAVEVFGEAFAMAATVLEIFMEDLEAILPALAPTTTELEHLGGIFSDLSREITQALPPLVDLAVTLTREFLPGVVAFVDDVGPRLPEIISSFVGVFERVLPMLQAFGAWFMRFAPVFTEFGFLVLNTINPALGFFGNLLTDTTRAINRLDNGIGSLIAGGSILAPVLLGIATLLTGPIAAAVGIAIGAVIGLNKIWQENIAGIQGYIKGLAGLVTTAFSGIQSALMAFAEGVGLQSLRRELSGLADALKNQMMANLEALTPIVEHFVQTLSENEENIRTIGSAVGVVARGVINLATAFVNILVPVFRSVIFPVFNVFIDILDVALEKVAQYIELMSAVTSGNLTEAVEISNDFLELGPDGALPAPEAPTMGESGQRIEVILDERTDVIEGRIEGTAERVVNAESRAARRNTGTPSGVR